MHSFTGVVAVVVVAVAVVGVGWLAWTQLRQIGRASCRERV